MIEARFRLRAENGSELDEAHASLLKALGQIAELWQADPREAVLSSSGESGSCVLSPFLKDGLNGNISYASRLTKSSVDRAICDDVITLRIDEGNFNYPYFAAVTFEKIVLKARPYRAVIVLDEDLDLDDYEEIVELAQDSDLDIDGRDTIYRFGGVNFFDGELCKRALRLSPEKVITRLNGKVECARIVLDGVIIIVTSDFVDRENLVALHEHVSELLRNN